MLPNVPEFAAVYYGVLRAGGVVVPLNPLLKAREVAYHLTDSGARLIFAWHAGAAEATTAAASVGADVVEVNPSSFHDTRAHAVPSRQVVDRAPEDTAVILYTSGTTGKPKGAELTHDNLYRNATVAAGTLVEISDEDRLLGALPLFHSFGQTCCLNAAVCNAAMMSMIPRFDPAKALEIIERDKITIFEGVPTMYNAMLAVEDRERFDTSTLRLCLSGGAAMPAETMRSFEEAFSCKILEGYGLSETSPVASFVASSRFQ